MRRRAERARVGFAFVGRDDVAGLVTPLLARRIAACLDAAEAGSVAALENGSPPDIAHIGPAFPVAPGASSSNSAAPGLARARLGH
jgi:hypothetical protein